MNGSAFSGISYKFCLYLVLLSLLSLRGINLAFGVDPDPPAPDIVEEEELEDRLALYTGNSVNELLEVCKGFNNEEDLIVVPGKDLKQCRSQKKCIPQCNEERIERLQDAQTRVTLLVGHLGAPGRYVIPFILFFIVLVQGTYLIIVKHFNWRTLPFVPGYMYVYDPTDGYRYRHYMWMKWLILDSDHPMYYHKMTADSQELEYEPQSVEWEDPEAGSDEEIHLPWSVTDIFDMTADPDERLEIYFRRIQQK
ncbi:unnamed protein product [Orchesella dallaii]|uniref:Uncharacterized protein n=1 Tax=Orchesella dallaii TaxID=48710 RepID=A0ABP1QF54_9HEXA